MQLRIAPDALLRQFGAWLSAELCGVVNVSLIEVALHARFSSPQTQPSHATERGNCSHHLLFSGDAPAAVAMSHLCREQANAGKRLDCQKTVLLSQKLLDNIATDTLSCSTLTWICVGLLCIMPGRSMCYCSHVQQPDLSVTCPSTHLAAQNLVHR